MTGRQLIRRVASRLHPTAGCSDGGCVFGDTGGMHTNGGCGCLKERDAMQLRRTVMQLADVCRVLAAVADEEVGK